MVKFLDLSKQYLEIKKEIDFEISNVMQESSFIGGKRVKKFEDNFSSFLDIPNCISVANGTDALEIALESLKLPKESEVIVPVNSWISSAESVTRTGHKVIFCDVNTDDYLINVEKLKNKISIRTSAIMPVHLFGQMCDMDPIVGLCKERNIKIIEDCAQSHGATYKGRKAGTIGDIACFSFYPGKNLGAYGDAGAIVCNDDKIANQCRMIANHGSLKKHDHQIVGRNSRLDALQASILSVKLKFLDEWTNKRNLLAATYKSLLKDNKDIVLPKINDWSYHAYHLYVIRHEKRDELKEYLMKQGIETGIHYPKIISKTPAYKNFFNEKFSISEFSNKILSLPIGDHLSVEEVEFVCKVINKYK